MLYAITGAELGIEKCAIVFGIFKGLKLITHYGIHHLFFNYQAMASDALEDVPPPPPIVLQREVRVTSSATAAAVPPPPELENNAETVEVGLTNTRSTILDDPFETYDWHHSEVKNIKFEPCDWKFIVYINYSAYEFKYAGPSKHQTVIEDCGGTHVFNDKFELMTAIDKIQSQWNKILSLHSHFKIWIIKPEFDCTGENLYQLVHAISGDKFKAFIVAYHHASLLAADPNKVRKLSRYISHFIFTQEYLRWKCQNGIMITSVTP